MKESISLKPISTSSMEHAGWGAGPGTTIENEFECPCGKGRVSYEKEDTPGFRESYISCSCPDCDGKYDFFNGYAYEK